MLRSVFTKAMRDQRRGLIGWSIGIVLLVLLEAAIWPSVGGMAGIEEFLSSYPEAMRKLFKLEDFGTGTGFMNAELYSALVPLLFIIFGVSRGARSIAGEEEAGTLEVLMVTPVSAARLVLHQAAALVAAMTVLAIALFASVALLSPVFDLGIGVGAAATGSLAMALLGIEFGALALAVGAVTGRRAVAIAVASIAAVAAYILYVFGELVTAVEPWQPLSPFHQALTGGPLGAGLPLAYGWMALAAVVVIAAAMPVFDRRDIATH